MYADMCIAAEQGIQDRGPDISFGTAGMAGAP